MRSLGAEPDCDISIASTLCRGPAHIDADLARVCGPPMNGNRFQRIWLRQLRRWRPGFVVVALYGLVFQAVLGGAAMSASLAVGDNGRGIICRDTSGLPDTGRDGAQRGHGQNCVCQGLCPQHGGAGIGPVSGIARVLPRFRASPLFKPSAIAISAPCAMRCASFARAPPGFDSRFA
jgi:hypothetical protein